jgi:hypothetical protein
MKKDNKFANTLSLSPIEFNDYMQTLLCSKDAEQLLIYLLSTSVKYKNKTKIARIYARFSFLRRNEELEMINDRKWYK